MIYQQEKVEGFDRATLNIRNVVIKQYSNFKVEETTQKTYCYSQTFCGIHFRKF